MLHKERLSCWQMLGFLHSVDCCKLKIWQFSGVYFGWTEASLSIKSSETNITNNKHGLGTPIYWNYEERKKLKQNHLIKYYRAQKCIYLFIFYEPDHLELCYTPVTRVDKQDYSNGFLSYRLLQSLTNSIIFSLISFGRAFPAITQWRSEQLNLLYKYWYKGNCG